ncbi:MAG: hypothetical protein P8R54_32035 [Myxococcota bacterium]|nr:hypothetical protein [Myxococcota bacterium]
MNITGMFAFFGMPLVAILLGRIIGKRDPLTSPELEVRRLEASTTRSSVDSAKAGLYRLAASQ